MYLYRNHRLQWVLSGALSAGLALGSSAFAQSTSTTQQTPQSGQQGDWGQAGPPPDAQNGQIPPQGSADQDTDQGPSQYPGQAQDQDANQGSSQNPAQGANQAPSQYPNQAPNSPAVGYGQAPRPAYQSQGNQRYQYQGGAQGPQSANPTGPVTLNVGLLLPIRTSEPLDSKQLKPGDYFQGTVARSIYVGNVIAIPRGAQVTGRVVDVKKPGELKGGANIALQLTSLNMGDNSYPLATDVFNTTGPGKGGYTAGTTVGTAALGAVIGAIAGGGPGAAIGAAAGTGVGLGASAATPGPRGVVPPEALLSFHLTTPATVQPLSAQAAYQVEANSAPPQQRYAAPPPYAYGGVPVGYPVPPPPPYGYGVYGYPYAYGYPYGYRYARGPYPYGRAYYYGRWR